MCDSLLWRLVWASLDGHLFCVCLTASLSLASLVPVPLPLLPVPLLLLPTSLLVPASERVRCISPQCFWTALALLLPPSSCALCCHNIGPVCATSFCEGMPVNARSQLHRRAQGELVQIVRCTSSTASSSTDHPFPGICAAAAAFKSLARLRSLAGKPSRVGRAGPPAHTQTQHIGKLSL